MFTTQFLTDMARNAGLNVFVIDGYGFESDRIRISHGETHLIVTLGAHSGDIVDAKIVEIASPQDFILIPGYNHVDSFSNARSMALLGWVITHIQGLTNEKAREDRREAEHADFARKAHAAKRAARRTHAAWKRELIAANLAGVA